MSDVSESSKNIKLRSPWTLSVILLTSVVARLWKQDYAISLKLQMQQRWPKPFPKALIKFCKVHEKKRTLNDLTSFNKK